jgi:polysaccharide chain length determinant protein (PEP-CTERM system associated)
MNHDLYLELERYVRLLMRRKRLLVLMTLLAMTLGVFISYSLPKKYEAKSTVFIEQSVISDLVKGIAISPSMNAKIRVLSLSMLSRETLSTVLRILDKDVSFTTDAALEGYMNQLRESISIRLDERRGVFFISFIDSDPLFARDLVNTITQVYIESNTASKRDESLDATRFLGEQIESFKKRIDVVEEEINKYKADHGLELAVDQGMIRLEISDKEKRIESLRLRQKELETQLRLIGTGPGGGGTLRELENQLGSLLNVYTENHPKVTRLRAQIEAVKARPGGGVSPDGSGISRALIRAEMESNAERIAKTESEIEEKMQLLRQIPTIRTELNELLRKKENETIIYNQLVTRYGQSEVSKQMEMENKSMTFRIVEPAVLPSTPISPKRLLIMLGSMVAGIGAGAALIILPYLLGGSIRSIAELRVLNHKVLAVFPTIPKPDEERQRKRKDMVFLGVAFLYFSMLVTVAVLEAMGKPYVEATLNQVKDFWF